MGSGTSSLFFIFENAAPQKMRTPDSDHISSDLWFDSSFSFHQVRATSNSCLKGRNTFLVKTLKLVSGFLMKHSQLPKRFRLPHTLFLYPKHKKKQLFKLLKSSSIAVAVNNKTILLQVLSINLLHLYLTRAFFEA